MRLFDCFTFFNELDLLELRLREIGPLVHRFVLVEAAQTFTGLPKPLHFKLNRSRFAQFLPKIVHVVLDEFPTSMVSAWDREHFSRRSIMRGLAAAAPEDLVLISDVDEIPRPEKLLAAIRPVISSRRVTIFESESYMYYLNVRCEHRSLIQAPRLIPMRFLKDPQAVRSLKPRFSKHPVWGPLTDALGPVLRPLRSWATLGHPLPVRILRNSAWHFTNMGGATSIRDKLRAYSHTEVATEENLDIGNLTTLIDGRRNVFDGSALITAPMSDLPSAIRNEPTRWTHCLATARPV